MRQVKLVISYDGTDFVGWQRQKSGRTIQGTIEDQLSRMHGTEVRIRAAGRTDSGVHADGQVVCFDTNLERLGPRQLRKAINGFLPNDIAVSSVEFVPDDFHPRYDALLRVYKYYIDVRPVPVPATDRFAWRLGRHLNLAQLNKFAAVVLGTHDFSAFSTPNEQVPNRVRTVVASAFYSQGPFVVYEIAGQSFLWRMVRSILGGILHEYFAGGSPASFAEILASGDRSRCGPSAPARGLFLHRVDYPPRREAAQ